MKLTLILSMLATLWAISAQAQQLTIRSGDHPTFSRLTVPLPASQPWVAKRTAQGVVLTLSGFAGSFDMADVFRRMQRNRISDISVGEDTLVLVLDCDCDATAFRSGPLLVIDVADSGTPLPATALGREKDHPLTYTRRLLSTPYPGSGALAVWNINGKL